ncbi:MAG: methylated-DNA--[protein]-cysteine S-methyltransferase [Desulfuromonadales bacterium]|nr:methylated-DNA--[protein]-cysteine S-methyltransferase [Desulfuromonadales bacterium]
MINTLPRNLFASVYKTGLGYGGVIASEKGLVEVLLPFKGYDREETELCMLERFFTKLSGNKWSDIAASELEKYFNGERLKFSAPIDFSNYTSFQKEVYCKVMALGYGEVKSYGEIALIAGRPGAARAVGGVMASNRLPIIIPCHRVIASDGSLRGYTAPGGIDSKKYLLNMEGVIFSGQKKVRLSNKN